MLIEAFLHVTARQDPAARLLGLRSGAVALWSRATRRRAAWAPHEAACHAVVREAVAGLDRRRTALVLGSGLGRDAPWPDLARGFERLVLVDAVHLLPARIAAWRLDARLLTLDLTGCGSWLAGRAEGPADPLRPLIEDERVDLVISANCLSQMPMGVEAWCEDHPEEARRLPPDLPARIVGQHLADLARFAGRVCLLSDVSYRLEGRDGAAEPTVDLLHGHALPPPDAAWDWTVAPFGEIGRTVRRVHRVHAWRDLAASRAGQTGAAGPARAQP